MKRFLNRLQEKLQNPKAGFIFIFALASITTVIAFAANELKKHPWHTPNHPPIPVVQPMPHLQPIVVVPKPNIPPFTGVSEITVRTKLSQAKVVRQSGQDLFFEVSVDTPKLPAIRQERKPTDMILVLDRSGSMAADNRLPYAKAAILSLMDRLREGDRIALIGFDNHASVYLPLTNIQGSKNNYMKSIVNSIGTGGSTNIYDGLLKAHNMIPENDASRTRRVILLSDGEANQGITNPNQLAQYVKQFGERNAVVSTIGMGIGFNESLMSLLADYGSGNYSYLENLATLDEILAKDLEHARAQYAANSRLILELAPGVNITDAAGYPIERSQDGSKVYVQIPTGQLRADSRKSFILTLKAPFSQLGSQKLVNASFAYTRNGKQNRIVAGEGDVLVEVVPQERRADAVASVDKELYRRSWTQNNVGKMKKLVAQEMRKGNKRGVFAAIKNFKEGLAEAASYSGIALMEDEAATAEVEQVKADADNAFAGPASAQKQKQNSYAKKSLLDSISRQRVVQQKQK